MAGSLHVAWTMAMAAQGSSIVDVERYALAATRLATPPPTAGGERTGAAAAVFTDTQDGELVQQRLGLTYGILGRIFFGLLLLSVAYAALAMPSRFLALQLSPAKLAHVAAILVLTGAWLLCRGQPQPRWVLATTDLVASLGLMTMAAIVSGFGASGLPSAMSGVLVFVLVFSLRAALVPSRPRWTALVAAIAAVPVPFGTYLAVRRDPRWPLQLVPRSVAAVTAIGWCMAGIVTAWAISRVVYGLRAEVKTAMRLGQYTLEEKIGEGGMGTVYRAHHALLQRPTAVKLLSPDRSSAASVQRFEREVQLTSKLTHPNTIAIYDYGHTQTGIFYYAMELIDGLSLQELCERYGPQPAERVVHILVQVASALAEAHAVGLIHRDVKPANIIVSERGGLPDFAKVLDFGLVKELGGDDPKLSGVVAITGTPLYLAPESIAHPDAITPSVDLYALGGVAYWLLTGAPPFDGANLVEICSHHLHSEVTPPSKRTGRFVPAVLDALVLACLAKTPEARPSSARALVKELRAIEAAWPWDEDEARRWWAGVQPRSSSDTAGRPEAGSGGSPASSGRSRMASEA